MPSGWRIIVGSVVVILAALAVIYLFPIVWPKEEAGWNAIGNFLRVVGIIGLFVGAGKMAWEKLR